MITNLRKLDLRGCYNGTDEGIAHVSQLPSLNLKLLDIRISKCVHKYVVEKLARELPDANIYCKHGMQFARADAIEVEDEQEDADDSRRRSRQQDEGKNKASPAKPDQSSSQTHGHVVPQELIDRVSSVCSCSNEDAKHHLKNNKNNVQAVCPLLLLKIVLISLILLMTMMMMMKIGCRIMNFKKTKDQNSSFFFFSFFKQQQFIS